MGFNMKFKRIMLVSVFLLAILTIGAVSASEDIASDDNLTAGDSISLIADDGPDGSGDDDRGYDLDDVEFCSGNVIENDVIVKIPKLSIEGVDDGFERLLAWCIDVDELDTLPMGKVVVAVTGTSDDGHVITLFYQTGEEFFAMRLDTTHDVGDAARTGYYYAILLFLHERLGFRSPWRGSCPTSHHFLSRQAGLPWSERSLLRSAHWSGYLMYLCITGLAVPTIQQFLAQQRTFRRTS